MPVGTDAYGQTDALIDNFAGKPMNNGLPKPVLQDQFAFPLDGRV